MTYGQGESLIAKRIEDWENNLPNFVKLAYLPSPGKVRLRLTARGENEAQLHLAINENVASLVKRIGDIIVGFDDGQTIEVRIGDLLKSKGKTLALAESCTGGKIAQMITSVSGASAYFKGGIVSYATQVKESLLDVEAEVIKQHTVVSAEVAKAMALGVKEAMNSDYALATTGNAGPDKGESTAEIGTVFIALATPDEVTVSEFNFGQPREKVIDRAANKALEMLQASILKPAKQ